MSASCRPASSTRLVVVASNFPIYDLARRVAAGDADAVWVHGADDVKKLASVKLGVAVGLGLDDWMESAVHESSPRARVLKVGDRVPTLESGEPYVWLDPQRARLIVKAICEEMARADASHAIAYRQRANEVDASLEALDKEIDQQTSPWRGKVLASARGGFGYFAERYRLSIHVSPDGAALDALGGGEGTDSYEKLLRFDVAQLGKQPGGSP